VSSPPSEVPLSAPSFIAAASPVSGAPLCRRSHLPSARQLFVPDIDSPGEGVFAPKPNAKQLRRAANRAQSAVEAVLEKNRAAVANGVRWNALPGAPQPPPAFLAPFTRGVPGAAPPPAAPPPAAAPQPVSARLQPRAREQEWGTAKRR